MNRLETQDGCFLDPVTYTSKESIRVVIANEGLLSRTYYDYSGSLKCWSLDTHVPHSLVPKKDKESFRCIDCVQNIKRTTGYRGKPCKFSTAISLVLEEFKTVCSLQLGGRDLFSKSENKLTLYQYRDYLKSNGENLDAVLTEIYFSNGDTHQPKIYFKPVRPLTTVEKADVQHLIETNEEQNNFFKPMETII